MSMPFDATLKNLGKTRPVDWVTDLIGPPSDPVEVLTPDLSTVSAFADLVFRIGEMLLHIDFHSGPDPDLSARLMLYNALLYQRYRLPVLTIVLLLRPRADGVDTTGRVQYRAKPDHGGMDFTFDVIRLWQKPVEELLTASLGVLPLATLGHLPAGASLDETLPGIVERLVNRIVLEASPPEAKQLLTSAYILAGLRLPREQVGPLFQGVRAMHESDTYMAILDEGQATGIQRTLLLLGRVRFGEPGEMVTTALRAITDLDRLDRMSKALLQIASWQELLETE